MTAQLNKAFGYQGDPMNLPVADVDTAVPFYESVLGFRVVSRGTAPKAATLARDHVQMRLVENGGDPTQDGCAFHVTGLGHLFEEFQSRGLNKPAADFGRERRGNDDFSVFYVVAPDGLCFWFGERQAR